MSRTHIHFATAPSHLRRNSWATVLLRLDVREALRVRAWGPPACATWLQLQAAVGRLSQGRSPAG
jgi:hypothetical protein